MRNSLIILFILIASPAFAGDYVCHNNGKISSKHRSVDGSDLVGCIKITRTEYDSLTRWHKVSDGIVVEMTQIEKDAIIQTETDAAALANTQRLSNIDDSLADMDITGSRLTRIETEINNIGSYSDLKKVLKRIVRYISTIESSQ